MDMLGGFIAILLMLVGAYALIHFWPEFKNRVPRGGRRTPTGDPDNPDQPNT